MLNHLHTPYFIYNGIDSRQMDIVVSKMPDVARASKRIEGLTVPGRDGSLHQTDGAYDSYTKTMECVLLDEKKVDMVAAWLTGSGEIIFSSEPDKVYRVTVINTVPVSQMLLSFPSFQVSFDTYPFKYSVNRFDEALELEKPAVILGKGTVYSQPVITVYGSGAVTITINGADYPLDNVDGHVTINSEIEECYKDAINMNNIFSADEFPQLEPGDNTISWTGEVEKIEIQPNWRWF